MVLLGVQEMRGVAGLAVVISCTLGACQAAGHDMPNAQRPEVRAEMQTESYKVFTDTIDRSRVKEFLSILAGRDARLTRQLELAFEHSADVGTHPDGLAELPVSEEVYPFYLWGPVIDRMLELELLSSFDPRAHDGFDPRVVRLRFMPAPAIAAWRAPDSSLGWVAGVAELDRLSQNSGMRLVALDNGSDSYLFAIVGLSDHDRLVELGLIVEQRVRGITELPF